MNPVARLVAGMACLAVLHGCSSEGGGKGTVVATAGDLTVTLAEFQNAYNKITPNYRPDISTLEARRDFANDLINRAILLDEGRKMGGISDPTVVDHLDRNLRQKMFGVLYREQVTDKTEVLGRDVAEVYENRKYDIKLSHVLVDDVETAKRIRNEIVTGKISFEDAAKKHSLDQSTKRRGGSAGQIKWSMNLPSFQLAAFEMEPGVVSEPYESEIGVHLIRVEERVPNEMGTLEEMRPSLRSDVRNQLEAARMKDYVKGLEDAAGLEWNEDNVDVLDRLTKEMAKLDPDTIPPARQYLPRPTPEQSELVLAKFGDKSWTIGDYVDHLSAQPAVNRPVTRLPRRGLKELIRTSQIHQELLYDEALRLGIDKRPEVIEEDARIREQVLMEVVHSRFIQQADVPEEDVRAVYDSTLAANPDAMMLPERVDMLIMMHSDPEVIRRGIQRIRNGEDEAKVISESSLDWRTQPRGGRTGLVARGTYAPQIEDVAFSGRAGKGWSEVIVTESGSAAVKVLVHEEPRIAEYDEMKDALTQNMALARGEAAFEAWLQQERDRRGIEIHDEVLDLIGKSVS